MKQFLKFTCVGVLNTLIDFAVLNALLLVFGTHQAWQYGAFKAVSFSFAVANSYAWNRRWVFAGAHAVQDPGDRHRERTSFGIVSVLGLLVNVGVSSSAYGALSALTAPSLPRAMIANAGAAAGTAAVLLFNYFGYKHLVFRAHAMRRSPPPASRHMQNEPTTDQQDGEVYLSVVIPAYNESERIIPTLFEVSRYLARQHYRSEVLVVDDGSTDATAAIVASLEPAIDNLRVIRDHENHGKGHAVKLGMRAARGHWRLFMDADNSTRISNLDRFLAQAHRGFDVVIGSIRSDPEGTDVSEHSGWHRRILGDAAIALVRLCTMLDVRDTQRGFKLFSRKAVEEIFKKQTIERFGFDIELLVIARELGFRIKELPVRWENPDGSKVRPRDYFRTLYDLGEITKNRLAHRYS